MPDSCRPSRCRASFSYCVTRRLNVRLCFQPSLHNTACPEQRQAQYSKMLRKNPAPSGLTRSANGGAQKAAELLVGTGNILTYVRRRPVMMYIFPKRSRTSRYAMLACSVISLQMVLMITAAFRSAVCHSGCWLWNLPCAPRSPGSRSK